MNCAHCELWGSEKEMWSAEVLGKNDTNSSDGGNFPWRHRKSAVDGETCMTLPGSTDYRIVLLLDVVIVPLKTHQHVSLRLNHRWSTLLIYQLQDELIAS